MGVPDNPRIESILCEENNFHATKRETPVHTFSQARKDDWDYNTVSHQRPSSRNTFESCSDGDSVSVSLARSFGVGQSEMEKKKFKNLANLLEKQNLSIFEKDVEEEAMKQFREVQQKVEKLMVEQLRSTRPIDPDPAPIATSLLVLGEESSDSGPHLVVFCSPKKRKRIQRLLNSSRVKKLCAPAHGAAPQLKVQVIGCSTQMRLAHHEAEMRCNSPTAADRTTHCGASTSLIHDLQGSSGVRKVRDGRKRKVIAGGIVDRPTFQDGNFDFGDSEDEDEEGLSPHSAATEESITVKPQILEAPRSSKAPVLSQVVGRRRSKVSVKSSNRGQSSAVDPALNRLGLSVERFFADPYSKQWDPSFSTDRNFKEDESWVRQKRDLDATGDDFGIFFADFEESVPSFKAEEVQDFCQGACLEDLISGAGISGRQRGAWLDDRSRPTMMSSQGVREYKNPLTPTLLYRLLNVSRFNNPNEPNVDRRLVYISNLNPYYILALTETASFHQVEILRDAIFKHIALQTSIRARINHRGYRIFRLELHLPYFALRTSPPSEGSSRAPANSKPPRQWLDLSFLELQSPKSESGSNYGIHEAHISFALCGSDHQRWTAYAFVDTAFDDEDLGENMSSYEGFHEDPIASDPWIEANIPIWDPREYFLAIFEARIARVEKEWERLVLMVAKSIKEYRNRHSSTLSQNPGRRASRAEDVQKTYEWTRQIVELLNLLLDGLSETITAWDNFNSPKGDINYFSDIDFSSNPSRNRCHGSLHNIKETFEALEGHQRTLQVLVKSCRSSARNLQLRLTMEGSEATKSGTATSDFTLFVLGPIALAAACFQLPQAVLPFPQNPKSFVILVLIIMVVMKLLHLVSGAIPGFIWWWKMIVALKKKMKLEGVGDALSVPAWSRLAVRRDYNQHDRNTQGVEPGPDQV